MRKLPPPSMASLPSTFLSVLVHASVIIATIVSLPAAEPLPVSAQVYVPIELVAVADTTNLTEVTPADLKDEVAEAAGETAAAPPPAPPPAEEDAISLEPPTEKPKEEPKKSEAKVAPAPSKTNSQTLDDILASIDKSPKPGKTNAAPAPSATPEAPRLSAGDKRTMTASITDIIISQMIDKKCWADHSDMADAKRLRTTFRVSFGRNGKFSKSPELIDPSRRPVNDGPLNTFITHADRGLSMCNQIGWYVPEDYFRLPQPAYIDLEFLPKIGAGQ